MLISRLDLSKRGKLTTLVEMPNFLKFRKGENVKDVVTRLSENKKETLKSKFLLYIKDSEKDWLEKQAEMECTSQNSIVRKAIKQYRNTIEPTPE